jgi:hypothetical protein
MAGVQEFLPAEIGAFFLDDFQLVDLLPALLVEHIHFLPRLLYALI